MVLDTPMYHRKEISYEFPIHEPCSSRREEAHLLFGLNVRASRRLLRFKGRGQVQIGQEALHENQVPVAGFRKAVKAASKSGGHGAQKVIFRRFAGCTTVN